MEDDVPAGFDPETGEVQPCPRCDAMAEGLQLMEDQIAGLQRDVRGWAMRYANLARDREQEARNHPMWSEVKELFDYWRQKCEHAKARFGVDRFELALPYVKKDGLDVCRQAIRGAAYDPFVTQRKNGKSNRHNGWDLIFRDRKHLEDFAERAPVNGYEPSELKRVATAILEQMPEDDRSTADRIHEAVGRAEVELRRKGR